MIVFIDESGDAGFKVNNGSSKTFVVVLVIFDEELDAEETALIIKKFRKNLKKTDRFEFKFNKCNPEIRKNFLNQVKNCNFKIRAIVIDKEKIRSPHLMSTKNSFYNFFLRMVLQHSGSAIVDAKIRLDGSGEKNFRQQMAVYLRKYLNSNTRKIMKNLRFRDSKRDVLIQLADMIAGSYRRYFDKNTDDWDLYRKILKKREEDVWEFK